MNTFDKNIKSILQKNPLLATKLISVDTNERFEVFLDSSEPLNINIVDRLDFTPIYKTTPLKEIQDRFEELKILHRYPYLYFFGIGNGILFKMLLKNDQHKRVLVVEPEIEILYIVLNFVDFSNEIEEERFVVLLNENLYFSNILKFFSNKNSIVYSRLYDLQISSSYYDRYNKEILELNRLFLKAIEHSVISAGNDSIDSLIGLEHHMMNIPKLLETPTTKEFYKNIKKSDTVILVSTGPSLAKQLKKLKEIQDSVVIVCVDASFPILYKNSIKPDVVVSMERVPLTGEFFKQTPKEAHEGVVFALSSLQHPNVINNIKAGTMQISLRPFGYTHATGPDDWGYVGIGMSAANKAFEHIYHGGFKQCILIGQDLAYAEGGDSHSKGHIFGEGEVAKKETDSYVTKYGGKGEIRTTYVWSMFRGFFESDIEHSKEKMLTINATEGGSRIEGAVELSFEEAISKYIDTDKKKKDIVLKYPTKKYLAKVKKKVDKNIQEMCSVIEEKLAVVKETFLEVAKMCEFLDSVDLENELDKIDFDKLLKINKKIEKIKSYFDDDDFNMVFIDSVQAFVIHQELEIAKIVVRDVQTDDDKKRKLIDWIKAHKFWLFSMAGCMEAVQVAITRKGSHYNETKDGDLYNYEIIKRSLKVDLGNFTLK